MERRKTGGNEPSAIAGAQGKTTGSEWNWHHWDGAESSPRSRQSPIPSLSAAGLPREIRKARNASLLLFLFALSPPARREALCHLKKATPRSGIARCPQRARMPDRSLFLIPAVRYSGRQGIEKRSNISTGRALASSEKSCRWWEPDSTDYVIRLDEQLKHSYLHSSTCKIYSLYTNNYEIDVKSDIMACFPWWVFAVWW